MPFPDLLRPAPAGTKRLTVLYIAALSAVALLTIGGQIVVQWSLAAQQHNSTVINLAGRQRMLSQKLAKTALLVANSKDPAEQQRLTNELQQIGSQWQQSHEGLRHGSAALELTQQNSSEVEQRFTQLEPHYQAILSGVRMIVQHAQDAEPTASIQTGLQAILKHEPEFLAQMNEIVFQYDRESQAAVKRLQTQERWLLAITLAVLLAEGLLVFRPAVGKIKSTLDDLRRTLVQLGEAKQAAEAANIEKSRFLARMSHELRTPLNAVLGLSDLLLAPSRDSQTSKPIHDPVVQEQLQTIRDAAESLLRLVNDLLDVGRIEEGGALPIESAPFDLRSLLTRTLRIFAPRAATKHLRLAQQVDDRLPDWFIGDAGRIQQILINLLNNAIKFTDAGEVRVEVQAIDCSEYGCRVALRVRDTGVGIPRAEQQRVFESFTQLQHPGRARQEGAGLGLSIALNLSRAMGGDLTLESEVGRGSIFTLVLPLGLGNRPQPDQVTSADTLPSLPLRVLVVEDTPANQLVLREMLAALGHDVLVVEQGSAALAAVEQYAFDVVLLDLELPDASGFEIAAQLRALSGAAHLPLIAITAHALPEYAERCEAAGFAGFLTKPLRIEPLSAMLSSVLSGLEPAKTPRVQPQLERWEQRPALLQSLIRLFHDEWPTLLKKIDMAIATADLKQLHFFAHRVKGMVSNFDDAVTTHVAQQLESAGDAGDLVGAQALRHELAAALSELDELLSKKLAGANPAVSPSEPSSYQAIDLRT